MMAIVRCGWEKVLCESGKTDEAKNILKLHLRNQREGVL